jgi:hypothetical protein
MLINMILHRALESVNAPGDALLLVDNDCTSVKHRLLYARVMFCPHAFADFCRKFRRRAEEKLL